MLASLCQPSENDTYIKMLNMQQKKGNQVDIMKIITQGQDKDSEQTN